MGWRAARSAAAARRQRQRALRAKLETAGLWRKRIRTLTPTEILGGETAPSARLRDLFDELGPLFSAFGEYLSLRADLLPLADCYELAPMPGRIAPTSARGIRALLQRELGADAEELLQTLSEPLRATPLFQWHRAALADGTQVSVKILRPEFDRQRQRDADLLDQLTSVYLLAQDGAPADLSAALVEFRAYLDRRIDLAAEVAALERMAAVAEELRTFVVPTTFPRLCSAGVVTTAAFPDSRLLSTVAPEADARQDEGDRAGTRQFNGIDLGRRLTLSWLQQALLGPVYPEGPFDEEVLVLRDGRLALTGGLFGRLEKSRQRDLLRYLTAVAKDEPNRACDLLLDQCGEAGSATPRARMRRLFRQAEPFRTAGWSRHYAGQRLADTLFVHWRLARKNGYRIEAPMEAFTRGLFAVEQQGRRIAPERDGLRQGLNDVRIIAGAVRMREYFGPTQLQENLHQLVNTASLALRRAADATRAETAAAKHDSDRHRQPPQAKSRRNLPFVAAGLLLVLAAGAIVAERLPAAGSDAAQSGPLGALFYSLVALLLFWYVERKDHG